ncbi:MAG: nucleoside triphosphate pyrophosphohydrolase [Gammaproteobacteria bacterium]
MPQDDRRDVKVLLDIMATLRDPIRGCPWDREQDFGSIAPYTLEEAYEVADAIDRGNLPELRDELGDLLFQVVFHSQMASELKAFDFGDVVVAISDKMVRRHPHVFAQGDVDSADQQQESWEALKAAERNARGGDLSVLAGVGQALPALVRADKLGRRAARVGLDWGDPHGAAAKVREELDELTSVLTSGERGPIQEEAGDLLLACASLVRHCRVDPEEALRQACRKFEQRFRRIEEAVRLRGLEWSSLDAAKLDSLWEEAKRLE